jgi:hypothetical protein
MANIPARSGLEIFVNDGGTITIRQDDPLTFASTGDEPMVVVHPDDVSMLIRALEEARRKARSGAKNEQDEQDEQEEVTVPAFFHPPRPVSSS